jgi:hypothetical protein
MSRASAQAHLEERDDMVKMQEIYPLWALNHVLELIIIDT